MKSLKLLWDKVCEWWAGLFGLVPEDKWSKAIFYVLIALMAGAFLYCWGYDFITHL